MTVLAVGTSSTTTTRYSLRVAETPEDFAAVARLATWSSDSFTPHRFTPHEPHFGEPAAGHDHLIVVDESDGAVVGGYPMIRPTVTRLERRLDAERTFDLGGIAQLRPDLVEAGVATIRPDHLGTGAVDMLWAGLARYLHLTGHRWLAGCVQIPVSDGFGTAEDIWRQVSATHLAPPRLRVRQRLSASAPATGAPAPQPSTASSAQSHQAINSGSAQRHQATGSAPTMVPALLRGYLRLGAWVCGPPAIAPQSPVADLFVLLSLDRIDPRHLRSFSAGSRSSRC